VFRNRCILLLGLIITCAACNSYVYFSWFPTYLESGRGVSSERTGWLAALVLASAAVGNLGGGWINDLMIRGSTQLTRARRNFGSAAYVLGALFLAAGMLVEAAESTSILLALSCLILQSTISMWWSCAIEISGRHVGALFGLMNGMGVFGAMGSQYFFGNFSDWRKGQGFVGRDQWDPAFYVVAGVLLIAAVCWQFVDSSRPIDAEENGTNRT
jgi:sugar phosphate permease